MASGSGTAMRKVKDTTSRCDEEGEGHYFEDYDSYDYTDPNYEYYQEDYDDGGWYWEQQEPWPSGEQPVETTSEESKKTSDETAGESFFKGKGKGKHDGCFICGSKWHMARDCPMQGTSKGKGKTKSPSEHHLAASHYKGKGKGKFGGGWRWRPRPKGSGYKGSGYRGYGGYGSKGKGKGKGYRHHWFTDASKTLTFLDGSDPSHREADKATPTPVERYTIHTDSEEDLMKTTRTRQVSQADDDPKSDKLNKSKNITLNFTTFHTEKLEVYHQVRGRERHGLLIDPGAASGLVGSDTLRLLQPYMTTEPVHDRTKTTPVSGISGGSDAALGQVTLSFSVAGTSLTYTAEVLGGDGSTCPALVGNPALRKLEASLLTQWFDDGDGLLVVRHPGHGGEPLSNMQFFRLLLTDSGHYILPLDDKGKHSVDRSERLRALQLFHHVATSSVKQWYDVDQDVRHCFLVQTTGSDRSETEQKVNSSPTSTTCSSPGYEKQVRFNEIVATSATEEALGLATECAVPVGDEPVEDAGWQKDRETEKSEGRHHDMHYDMHHDVQGDFTATVRRLTYSGDQLPPSVDARKLERRYKAIPEEYHTKSGLMPVTPENFRSWFTPLRGRGLRWHFWEIFSGSGRLSLTLLMAGLLVGFPVDFRYGWDLCDLRHQALLLEAYHEFQPGCVHLAPDCQCALVRGLQPEGSGHAHGRAHPRSAGSPICAAAL